MKYTRTKYPDGQISAKILSFEPPLVIKERITSYEDLMFIRSLADIMEHHSVQEKHLEIVCLLGQRSDRRFGINESFDLKLIAEVINACNFTTVTILDPHSDVATALITKSSKIDPFIYVKYSAKSIVEDPLNIGRTLTLVTPDAGAYKKGFTYGYDLGLRVVSAVKHRSSHGEISLSLTGTVENQNCLIIDDLCDGGRTFIELAAKLKEAKATKVYLYVTHGYFSKGFLELQKDISHIYCTNSVFDIKNDFVTQFRVI